MDGADLDGPDAEDSEAPVAGVLDRAAIDPPDPLGRDFGVLDGDGADGVDGVDVGGAPLAEFSGRLGCQPPRPSRTSTSVPDVLAARPPAGRDRTTWAVAPARTDVAGPEPTLRSRLDPAPWLPLPPQPWSRLLPASWSRLTIGADPARGARPPAREVVSRLADQFPRVSTDHPPAVAIVGIGMTLDAW